MPPFAVVYDAEPEPKRVCLAQSARAASKPARKHTREEIISSISCLFEQICQCSDQQVTGATQLTRFHASSPSSVTVSRYLTHVAKYAECSNEVLLLATIYVDRAILRNADFNVTSLTVHRVILASIVIAAKFLDDRYFSNKHYAKVGGLPTEELNALEVEMLYMLGFELFVEDGHLEKYLVALMESAALAQSMVSVSESMECETAARCAQVYTIDIEVESTQVIPLDC